LKLCIYYRRNWFNWRSNYINFIIFIIYKYNSMPSEFW